MAETPSKFCALCAPAGPVWFQKMDRNHHGDVSRRELLGPRDQFERLDRDTDGLIDPDEAKAGEVAKAVRPTACRAISGMGAFDGKRVESTNTIAAYATCWRTISYGRKNTPRKIATCASPS